MNSTADLPEGVDCAVLAIPRAGVLDAVEGCAARGVGGVIIFAAGFAEAGPDGRALQAEIARIAREHGMAVAGPNCLGHINYVDGIPLTFSASHAGAARRTPRHRHRVAKRRHGDGDPRRAACRAISRSRFTVSTGNEAVNGIEDFLDFLIDDDATHVIADDGRAVPPSASASWRSRRRARGAGKPIVLLHPGRSAAAAHRRRPIPAP